MKLSKPLKQFNSPIYLDYAATTPIAPEAVDAMLPYLTQTGLFANPSSIQHGMGEAAESVVERSRSRIAEPCHGNAKDFVFTSGATEANNLAIKGIALAHRDRGRHIVTTAIEHKSVLDTFKHLESQSFAVTYLRPDSNGRIVPDDLLKSLSDETILVSVMQINNETGVIQPIEQIADALADKNIFFHVDAAQSAGKLPIDLSAIPIDLLSISAHKFYGPKGIGCLFIRNRKRTPLAPLLHGGGQEFGLRPGTLATHQIAGMAEAFGIAHERQAQDLDHAERLRKLLLESLQAAGDFVVNGDPTHCLPNIVNLSFANVDASALLIALRDQVAIASGSACNSGAVEASHVLRAMGIEGDRLYGAVRISFGRYTTETEIVSAGRSIAEAVERLRTLALE
ncbi:cysteine desulfurase family protein [Methylotuvimicrobium buryatense]|uniref:cysteine desulfurase family protein n=1 Tax=Methylotuvimicrobium buryatense TaxID=95641 RepID=UPI0003476C5A|nr:cysteine desulfurase family protein [Methylotuvimicrobium buryatense]